MNYSSSFYFYTVSCVCCFFIKNIHDHLKVDSAGRGSKMFPFLLFVGLFTVVFAQTNFDCESKTSCSECITTSLCVWCSFPGRASCSDTASANCSDEYLVNPVSEIVQADNIDLSDDNQISLSDISVDLTVGQPLDFTVSIKAAQDFPLDVYVLMDLSYSFAEDLKTVKALAPQLPLTLRNVSSDFAIGFGSYTDKPVLPFTSRIQYDELFTYNGKPSSCRMDGCIKPFAYEHVVDLTNSSEVFRSSIEDSIISTNADNPEGTLEGMLQSAICNNIVGWREKSRKILLIMTDDVIHSAGDGTLTGIVKPNDGLCHTQYIPSENKTLYTAALTQDYPSIDQVNQALQDNNIVPIFAIATSSEQSEIFQFYQNIISPLFGGFALLLSEDSGNLQEVLQEAYSNVVSKARLNFVLPDYISANITAHCPENSTYIAETYECLNISNGEVNFTVSLTLNYCPNEIRDDNSETIVFNVPGFGSFQVDMSAQCTCDCENATVSLSPQCSNSGDFTCGLCHCNEGWSGPDCSCSTAMCPLGPNGLVCSGRGECHCGRCVCDQPSFLVSGVNNPRIEGDACECSNYECDIDSNGVVCSGRGVCTCSNGTYACRCNRSPQSGLEYAGDSCQCSPDNCIDTTSTSNLTQLCNENGNCDACQSRGVACTCNTGYIGEFCELAIRGAPLCNGNEDCVKCYAEAIKDGSDPIVTCRHLPCDDYSSLTSSQDRSNYVIPNTFDQSTRDCSFSTVECRYIYYVAVPINSTTSTIVYQVEPEDCLPIPIWAIALIIVVGLLIIGVLVLISIKLILIYQDYREYKKFEYEVKQSEQTRQENPVYLNPVTQTDNPIHGKPL